MRVPSAPPRIDQYCRLTACFSLIGPEPPPESPPHAASVKRPVAVAAPAAIRAAPAKSALLDPVVIAFPPEWDPQTDGPIHASPVCKAPNAKLQSIVRIVFPMSDPVKPNVSRAYAPASSTGTKAYPAARSRSMACCQADTPGTSASTSATRTGTLR